MGAPGIHLETLLRELVREECEAAVRRVLEGQDGEWVNQHTSELGNRRHCKLVREGKIPGRKVGKLYLARRSDVDAWLGGQSGGPGLKRAERGASAPESGVRLMTPEELKRELAL